MVRPSISISGALPASALTRSWLTPNCVVARPRTNFSALISNWPMAPDGRLISSNGPSCSASSTVSPPLNCVVQSGATQPPLMVRSSSRSLVAGLYVQRVKPTPTLRVLVPSVTRSSSA
jgi:hypothetical protein